MTAPASERDATSRRRAEGTGPGGFTFDEASDRYRDARGRFVTRKAVRDAIDQALSQRARRAEQLAADLRAGRISLERWRVEMRTLVRDVQLYSAAAAKGGWGELTQADYGRIGARVREQYRRLERFAQQIANRTQPLDGRFTQRGRLYAAAARSTYHAVERGMMIVRGFDQEANILTQAEHCPGCLKETARGPVPIGTLVPVGERQCLVNCKCRIEYRNSETGEVAR